MSSNCTKEHLIEYSLAHPNQDFDLYILFNFINLEKGRDMQCFKSNIFPNSTIQNTESTLYFNQYYGENKEQVAKYKNRFISALSSELFQKIDIDTDIIRFDEIEDLFSIFCFTISANQNKYNDFISSCYIDLVKNNLKEDPINFDDFPTFNSEDTSNQNDEELLSTILEQKEENFTNNFETQTKVTYPLSNILEFNRILSKYTKSFSKQFVSSVIKKLDSILSTLQINSGSDNDQNLFDFFRSLDSKSDEFICFKMILQIKLRLFAFNHQIHDFLIVLLQLIIIDQENNDTIYDDHLSYKKFINNILPNCETSRRSTIIKNISIDEILDFSFSNDGQNDFILTKKGLFKVTQNSNECNFVQIEFSADENWSLKGSAKISFSNGVLYLLLADDKQIYKVIVSEDEEVARKSAEKQKKLDKAKEHLHENQKSINKNKNAKKEKRVKRKKERYEDDEKMEIDLENIKIDIPQYPIVSFGVYDNYARIVQRINCDDKKSAFILTNIDLTPNNRINYNIEEAFDIKTTEKKFIETQTKIEIDEKLDVKDVFLQKDYMFFLFEDSSFQQWMILKNGQIELIRTCSSPLIFHSNSMLKIDNKSFLYYLVPIKDDNDFGISITQIYLPETKHFLREDSNLFLKYPFLHKLSTIVDNCSQLILNQKINNQVKFKDYLMFEYVEFTPENPKEINDPLKLSVSSEEMSFLVQSIDSIGLKTKNIKLLIKDIKDENLKVFFITMLIKLVGINLLYEINNNFYETELEEIDYDHLKELKSFIFYLYSLIPSMKSFDSNIMISESLIFTLSISGKFLFLPDSSYLELHNLMNQILNDKTSKKILKTLSYFMFSYNSSLYIIDQSIYDQLVDMQFETEIYQLFIKSIFFIFYEIKNSDEKTYDKFAESISPYIKVLFQYIQYTISNESIPFTITENLLINIFCLKTYNAYLSLILEKELIGINNALYNRIKKIPGVIESDKDFLEKNQDLKELDFHKETRIIESKHPYNENPVPVSYIPSLNDNEVENLDDLNDEEQDFNQVSKNFFFEDLATIDFGLNADFIYLQIDNASKISKADRLFAFSNENIQMFKINNETLNEYYKIFSNRVRIAIGRDIRNSQEVNQKLWGCKLIVTGVKYNDSFYWKPNKYLTLYANYIAILMKAYTNANNSTKIKDKENDYQTFLNANIIQGIKIEDIDNYEANQDESENQTKQKVTCNISRGISRGISYDSQNESHVDDELKKNFIKDIITIKDNQVTPAKRLIDAIYQKTAKKNRIKLNKSSEKIIECEYYLAACLFKQLGLISTCIDFIQVLNTTKKEDFDKIEFPNSLVSLWKTIYSLRNKLFYEYLKSKSSSDTDSNQSLSNYEELIKSVKQKCKLLIYSDPILKYQTNIDDCSINSAISSIFSFVMSKIKLSDISKFIDIREERYSISKESVSLLQSFLDQNLMFESSKSIFTCFCRSTYPIYNCLGIKQREIDEYNQISNILTLQITKNIYTQQSVSMLTHQFFLINDISRIYNKEILIQISKIIIDIFQRNKKNNSFFNNEINFILIHILVVISFKSEDNELINYITSLLLLDEIDINTKLLIFYCIPAYIHFIPSYNNLKVSDESFAFSIISNNKKNPAIIKNAFYWLASLFNNSKEKLDSHQKFILTVFKGIGQSFVAKSCLFIDDSFDQTIHNEVSHSMISFIRLLYNKNNTDLFELIHDILQNKIQNIENDDMFISIGLFISFGQNLSGKEIQKKYMPSFQFTKSIEQYGYIKKAVLLENKNLELNEKEIDNILKLHDVFIHSNCLNGHQKYEGAIDDNEINKSILIASFYSFLPIIMQITNNARILMNDSNINRTLSIFDLATKPIPSNTNSISELSKMLSSAILETTLQNEIKFCDSIKFMKMNYGEVVYANGEGNDIIKTNKNHFNIFICNRPFDFECETYFEICPHGDGWKKVFIGFIDSEDSMFDKAFGFGCIGNNEVFCRKSPHLAQILNIAADDVMKKEQIDENKFMFKEGNKIGCYFTSEYSYLTINGNLTPYRLSNKSLKSYFPVIITDHVNIEIEITKNISIVNESDFLGIKFVPKGFFEEKDINIYCKESISWTYRQPNSDNSYSDFPLIGCKANALLLPYNDSDIETIDVYPKDLLDLYLKRGVIKDMIPLKDNPFVSKYIVEFFNHKKVMHQTIQIDSRSLFIKGTSFMNMVGRLTGADFVFNELNLKCLPNLLTLRSYLNLNDLKKYMINKIINDNSKSIAIIMTKYLSFILIDYLRYSKSKLLQDEGINSKEMQIIIKSLAHSLPTITEFQPSFELPIDDTIKNKYIIFPDEKVVNDNFINNVYEELNQQLVFKTPGDSYMFNYSFKIFLNKSQNNISTRFLSILMKEIFDNTKNNSLSLTQIYDLIPSYHKLESISPLPDYYSINIDNLLNEINLIGAIPIIVSSIPDHLPCIKCFGRRFRLSSDKISYFCNLSHATKDVKWSYNIEKINKKSFDRNFKLKCGYLLLYNDLNEMILNSPLGYIQIVFSIFQVLLNSENQNNKLFQQILIDASSIKDILSYPFLKPILISAISKIGYSNITFNLLSSYDWNNIISSNDEYFVFNLYFILNQAANAELQLKDKSLLFDNYLKFNNELFKILANENKPKFIEGTIDDGYHSRYENPNKTPNQIIYLLYFYSILLRNKSNFPYPKFLFVHDLMRQKFGGFRTIVSKDNIAQFDANNNNICYKSEIFYNENDLECSCQIISQNQNRRPLRRSRKHEPTSHIILHMNNNNTNNHHHHQIYHHNNRNFGRYNLNQNDSQDDENSYKIFIHQLNNDEKVELPHTGEKIRVSFPLEIIICIKSGIRKGQISSNFVITFSPSYLQQKEYFINNYDEFQEDFNQFIQIGKFDNELSKVILSEKENNNNEDDYVNEDDRFDDNQKSFKSYELERIPKEIKVQFTTKNTIIKPNILAIRCWILNKYRNLIESNITSVSNTQNDYLARNDHSPWNIQLPSIIEIPNMLGNQMISPLYSMDTEFKFKFINHIFMKQNHETPVLLIVFNRFEQQKFFETKNDKELNENRPLFVQFMSQVDPSLFHYLKVRGGNSFNVELVGEKPVDAGGPGRELFSSLIVEMMNEHIHIFTFNPNRQHEIKETNQEDLIPSKLHEKNDYYHSENNNEFYLNHQMRFNYAGVLIAICIVSDLPQQMKLASFIWEYLTCEKVSIENIYEIDNNFKELIENAERLKSSSINEDEFESQFPHTFEINDSFDNIVELIPSGSNKRVTKENLSDFIEHAKNYRIHEFDQQLKQIKIGFDIIMCYKNITNILHPNELKLLVCGEPNCSVDQMKKLFNVHVNDSSMDAEKVVQMFWNVIESFSVEERILFIKFSSGNMGLPAPGLKWKNDINVIIKEKNDKDSLAKSYTCFSSVNIPYFESEEQLSKILKASINFSGLIIDNNDNIDELYELL